MASSGKVDWYANDVLLRIEGATDELLSQLAFYVEGETKVRMNVDTGFMRNAVYAITPLANRRAQAQGEARAVADRPIAPDPDVDAHSAAVHGAAEYTIYQEMLNPALYPALEKAQQVASGIIQEVGRAKL